jgi:hypothetical protein
MRSSSDQFFRKLKPKDLLSETTNSNSGAPPSGRSPQRSRGADISEITSVIRPLSDLQTNSIGMVGPSLRQLPLNGRSAGFQISEPQSLQNAGRSLQLTGPDRLQYRQHFAGRDFSNRSIADDREDKVPHRVQPLLDVLGIGEHGA